MKIAFVGQKGLPAQSGGVEVHVEALGARLAAAGHAVTVYTRATYCDPARKEYRGMRLKSLPTLPGKHTDALVHCLLSTLHAIFNGAQIIHFQAHAPSVFTPLARLTGRKAVSTVHTLEYTKAKWGGLARRILQFSEWVLMKSAHAVITVAPDVTDYLHAKHGRLPDCIPNGVEAVAPAPPGTLEKSFSSLGLAPGNYFLSLGRLVPEKKIDFLIRAYAAARAAQPAPESFPPLAIAGGASGSEDYLAELQSLAAKTPGCHLLGPVYGEAKQALLHGALAFLLPSKVEGHPIALLEALSCGLPVIASDISSVTAIGGAAEGILLLPCEDQPAWQNALSAFNEWSGLRAAATAGKARLLARYDWDQVTKQHLDIYQALLSK